MTAESPAERTLRARAAAHVRWAHESDRSKATSCARAGLQARFEREVDPDRRLDPIERAKRVESRRKAYYADLARRSAAARRKRKAA
jgi:hypothetical protein